MKKTALLAFIFCAFFSCAVYAKDVSHDFWAYNQIIEAENDGWFINLDYEEKALASTVGKALSSVLGNEKYTMTDDGKYITRGELSAVLYEILPRDDSKDYTPFSDTALNEYNYSIIKCAGAGILSGYSDGTFKPDRAVTNAELAVIMSKLKENRAQALELYSKADEKSKTLKSFTMDTNVVCNVSAGNMKTNIVSKGSLKTAVNDLENLDIEMSGVLDTSVDGEESQKVNLYYKDNTYYADGKTAKIKYTLDFKDLANGLGLDYYNLESKAAKNYIVMGYVKENGDGTKRLYAKLDILGIFNKLKIIPGIGEESLDSGECSMIMNIDGDGGITSYNIYCDMLFNGNLGTMDYEMTADYTLRDIDTTSVDVPGDLDEYQDMEEYAENIKELIENGLIIDDDEGLVIDDDAYEDIAGMIIEEEE